MEKAAKFLKHGPGHGDGKLREMEWDPLKNRLCKTELSILFKAFSSHNSWSFKFNLYLAKGNYPLTRTQSRTAFEAHAVTAK